MRLTPRVSLAYLSKAQSGAAPSASVMDEIYDCYHRRIWPTAIAARPAAF
jgi:hypothetical protein